MNCPSDGTTLLMSERQGIEIDYCPQCRGIWLDRGELDKMLDQAKAESASTPLTAQHGQPAQRAPQGYGQPAQPRYDEPRYGDRREGRYGDPRQADPRYGDPRYRKKKSPFEFLGDIFDS